MKAKRVFLFLCVMLSIACIAFVLWTGEAEENAHFTPDYARMDLAEIWGQEELAAADYQTLSLQTGVGQGQLRRLWNEQKDAPESLLLLQMLQKRLFETVEIECRPNTIISREEKLVADGVSYHIHEAFPFLEKGDILLSFSSHAGGWRCGHAGLVVDVLKGQTLEARVLGTDSSLLTMKHWLEYPTVAVLRVKGLSKEQREAVADYAREALQGIPYRLLCGKQLLEGGKAGDITGNVLPEGTHCAHLIWSAYAGVGIDLDGDGGPIVTPKNILEDDAVEIIQIYGMDTALLNS